MIENESIGYVNRFRGILLQSFIGLEHVMGACVVFIKYNGVYSDYYKKYKTASMVINDFVSCYEKEQSLFDKYFTSKDDLKSDLENLMKIRDVAAHFQWFNTDEAIKYLSIHETVIFMSYRYGKEATYGMSRLAASAFQTNCLTFLNTLVLFQRDLHEVYSKPLYGDNPNRLPDYVEFFQIQPLTSLKNI